jgi:hypothetical protein
LQIGFLTEWQLYAQKLEGDNWAGEKLDKSKLDKLSGMVHGGHLLVKVTNKSPPPDQQVGQLFELMQSIKNSEEDGEGEKQ